MAVGDSITPGYNPATFTLGCGFTKTDDNVSTTPDQTCTAGTLTIDGKYNIYFRRRLRETKQYEDVGGNAGVGGYRLYTAGNKAQYLTGAGASTAEIDLIEFVMCTNTIEVIAESALTGVIDKESVPIVSDGANGTQGPEGPAGRDVGENLIDGTGEVKVIDSFDGSGADGVSRWYSNMFTLNDVNLSPNLHYSCQMRVKLEGCDDLNGRNFRIHLTTKGSHYPFICEFTPTENGTYTIKKEDFTISYASEGFLSGVTFGWDLSIGGDISLGTITIDKVKLEVGEKCTTWCLSENDKRGENTPYYHETYYGWSASASTAVANTDPGDVTWARIVPSKQADKPYLWMRDRVMTWSSSERRYIEGSYTYTRITGENGTGVRINGSFTKSDWYGYGSIELYLRETYPNPTTGDCYIYQEDGHLWVWNGTTWQDVGRIKGTDGTSQYIHWAWCNTLGPTDQGDEGYPDWTGLNTGFTTTKDAEAKYKYIGVLANDTESPDPGEEYAGYYEWNEVEGPQGPAGKNSVRIDLSNQTDAIAADSNGKARFARTITTTAKVYDGATPVKSGVTVTAATITVVRNGVSTSLTSNPTYGSGGATFSWTIQEGDVLSTVSYPVSISLSYGSPSVAYTAEFTLTRIDAQAVFQLLPSRDSIDFVRQANNTLSPTNIQIWCGYKKYTGSGTETYASNYNGEGVTNFENSGYSIYVRHLKADGTPNIWDATGNTSPYGWIVMAYTGDYVRDIYSNTAFSAVQFCIAPAKDRTQWTDADIIDLETIPIVKDGTNGADGTSPWVADLNNEMDSVSCDDTGYVLMPANQTTVSVSTVINLHYGSTPKKFKITAITRNNSAIAANSGVTVSPVASTTQRDSGLVFTVTYGVIAEGTDAGKTAKISGKDDFAITIQSVDETFTRTLHFIVNGIIGDVYNLKPSVDEIHAERDGSGNYVVNGYPNYMLTCGYTKNVKGTITEYPDTNGTAITGKIDSKYNIYHRRHNRAENTWGNYYLYTGNKSQVTGLNLNTYDAVEFILCTNATNTTTAPVGVIDRETVYVIADGEVGPDGIRATVSPDKITIPCNEQGGVIAQVQQALTFAVNKGTISSVSEPSSLPTGVTITGTTSKTITIGTTASDSDLSGGIVFTVSGTDNNNNESFTTTCTLALICSRKGTQGNGNAITLIRNNYTETQWNDYAVLDGEAEDYSHVSGDPDFTLCRIGDIFTVSGTATDTHIKHTAEYQCTAVSSSMIWGICISHITDGANGQPGTPGHIGRWYEFYGEYPSDYQGSDAISNSSDHGWFIKKGDYFYMLIADAGEPKNITDCPTSTTGNSDWEYMGGDRKYYIAEAMFADEAYLGSFVINHDWMISKQGGPSGKTYSDFNPQGFTSYAIGNNPNYNGFIPHFAVDGLTGKVYMNDAYVSGTINASTIKGTVVVGDNSKAYMEIVPTTEGTEGSYQVYRADILGKSDGVTGDALDIGVYRLRDSNVMGSHISLRYISGTSVLSQSYVGTSEISVTDGTHTSSMLPLSIVTETLNADDINSETIYASDYVKTKVIKGSSGGLSKPVAFPSNIITSDRVELDNNLPAGAIVFAPNCKYVKSSQSNVYASRNDDGILNNLTTSTGHEFGNKASRIFVKYSTEYWKEFDCQGP